MADKEKDFLLYLFEAGRLFELIIDLSWNEALLAGESWTRMHGSHHAEICEKDELITISEHNLGRVNWSSQK